MKSKHKLHLYYATGSRMYLYFLLIMNIKNILISYAYPEPWKSKEVLKMNGIKVLCDSGAFTAWSLAQKKKKEGDKNWKNYLVDIDKYIEFVKKNEDIISNVINLDVIGGEQGVKPTAEDNEKAAQQGWKNLEYMWSKEIEPVHVFHQGERFEWLERMLKEPKLTYIGISPNNDCHDTEKIRWLDICFRKILKINPKMKTHGFGVTSFKIMERYPWYSCDSSSYSLTASFGNILTPHGRVFTSDKNKHDNNHIENKPKEIQEHIDKYLSTLGLSLKSVTTDIQENVHKDGKVSVKFGSYMNRNLANIYYYKKLEEKINKAGANMAFHNQKTLFDI